MIIVMTYAGNSGPEFTGQFTGQHNAAVWGRNWSVQNDDDPRWQVLDVPASFFNQRPTLNHIN